MVECDIAVKPNLKINWINIQYIQTRYTHFDDQLFIQQQQPNKIYIYEKYDTLNFGFYKMVFFLLLFGSYKD